MATTVKWALVDRSVEYDAEAVNAFLDITPKRVLPTVLSDPKRSYATAPTGKAMYGKCYAFLDYFKNVYAICAPFDIELIINEQGAVTEVKAGNNALGILSAVMFRSDPNPDTNLLVSIKHDYIFFSDSEVLIEQLPPFMDYTLMKQGITVIPGSFDISKWIRPVETALEIAQGARSVVIPADTPLTYVRFVPKDRSAVKLERVEYTDELEKTSRLCTKLKEVRPQQPLHLCYMYAKKVVDAFIRPRRCLFNFGRK